MEWKRNIGVRRALTIGTAGLAFLALTSACGESQTVSSKRTPEVTGGQQDAAAASGTQANSKTPAASGAQAISFALTVNPLLSRGCGGSSCHGAGSSSGAFVGHEDTFVAAGSEVLKRLASTDKSLMMPLYGFPVTWSAADSKVLSSFLQQQGINAAGSSTTTVGDTGGGVDGGDGGDPPTSTPVPVQTKKLCADVTPSQKTSGAAMTFDQVTVIFKASCGAAGCHVGAAPHGFVGRPESLQDQTYAAGIVIDIQNGSMPKTGIMSAADKAAAIAYLCARFDF